MATALIIFISQFAVVFLLGIQSLMVRDSNCWGSAIGAVFIGVSQFFVFSIIGGLSANGMFTSEGVAFLLAGPFAIVSSIKMHPVLVAWFSGSKAHGKR
tara:strand:+ start:2636 stop:2932 length:297 start_codon:yes stop_codon:yes gene_type:complete